VKQLDVTDEPSVRKAVEEVIAEFGRLDVLINNAGWSQTSLTLSADHRLHMVDQSPVRIATKQENAGFCAGYGSNSTVEQMSLEAHQALFDTDYFQSS
jgi:NAD(P)-dependent dehydrogenase (short-subunit alcohol dehydrogenase family)